MNKPTFAYRFVRETPQGLVSPKISFKELQVTHTIKSWTWPKVKGTKLHVFLDLPSRELYLNEFSNCQLWKVQVYGSLEEVTFLMPRLWWTSLFGSKWTITNLKEWWKTRNVRIGDGFGHVMDKTYLAKAIKLLEKVKLI